MKELLQRKERKHNSSSKKESLSKIIIQFNTNRTQFVGPVF